MGLSLGSPAVDVAFSSLDNDQRGVARPQGISRDLGAFEYAPVIINPFAVDPNVTTAGLGATINYVYGVPVTERGIVWSVTNGFAPETGTRVADLGLFGTGIFTQQVSNLVSGVTNFYRAYAVNHAGTSYTEQAWTLMRPEAPGPGPASDIQPTRFALTWPTVRGATNTFLEVSEDELFASFVAGYQARVLGEAVTHTVTGLNAGVLYYYRLWSENAAGPSTHSVTGSVLTAPRLTILTWPREGGPNHARAGQSHRPLRVADLGYLRRLYRPPVCLLAGGGAHHHRRPAGPDHHGNPAGQRGADRIPDGIQPGCGGDVWCGAHECNDEDKLRAVG